MVLSIVKVGSECPVAGCTSLVAIPTWSYCTSCMVNQVRRVMDDEGSAPPGGWKGAPSTPEQMARATYWVTFFNQNVKQLTNLDKHYKTGGTK